MTAKAPTAIKTSEYQNVVYMRKKKKIKHF